MLRQSIEEHLEINDIVEDEQAGFTDGGTIENNLLILKHCIETTYKSKGQLLVISVDFTKA